MTKADWIQRERRFLDLFREAAKQVSPEGKAELGSLAWGRHDAECGPNTTLQSAIHAASFLEGYYIALVRSLSRADSDILIRLRDKMNRGK